MKTRFVILGANLVDLFAAQHPGYYLRQAESIDMSERRNCPACGKHWCKASCLDSTGSDLWVVQKGEPEDE